MINNKDEIGRQLKIQTERAAKMSDKELGEIRQNIRVSCENLTGKS